MGGGIDPHGRPVRILAGDPLVHLEEVPVTGLHLLLADARESIGEVEIHAAAERPHPAPLVTHLLDRT